MSRSLLLLGLAACATTEPHAIPIDDQRPKMTSIEISELEISAANPDRFVHCPPPGELGQRWIPNIPTTWNAPRAAESPPPSAAEDGGVSADLYDAGVTQGSRTERAVEATRLPFKRCYRQGLLRDPTQDGHVAIVMRVTADGRVAQVESYGACDLAATAIGCMKEYAMSLRFEPTAAGTPETITVPVVYTGTESRHTAPTPLDAYTAEVYLAAEAARPALHACEERVRARGRSTFASATFGITIDKTGTVEHAHIDPWRGEQLLLECAADAVNAIKFPPPPAGRGFISLPIVFNPRANLR